MLGTTPRLCGSGVHMLNASPVQMCLFILSPWRVYFIMHNSWEVAYTIEILRTAFLSDSSFIIILLWTIADTNFPAWHCNILGRSACTWIYKQVAVDSSSSDLKSILENPPEYII